jgi:hypothetical protein
MKAEEVFETLDYITILTQLMAWEKFVAKS